MSVRKRYKVKPRFFIVIAVILCLLAAGAVLLLRGCGSQDTDSMEIDLLRTQRIQGEKMASAARRYISNKDLHYDGRYIEGGYPPDDIGVCTDVVWKAMEAVGVNVKDLVEEDIRENFEAYDDIISVQDPDIDFRLVPQLERFFERNAVVLTTDVDDILAWQPGDIVTFESSHVAVVSPLRNIWGRPYIIQHGKDPAGEEDRIYASDGMKISGHFRWNLASGKAIKANEKNTENEYIETENIETAD